MKKVHFYDTDEAIIKCNAAFRKTLKDFDIEELKELDADKADAFIKALQNASQEQLVL